MTIKDLTMVDGNKLDMSKAALYKKDQPVIVTMIAVETVFHHDWGDQRMGPGSILVIDPSTSTCWGCETFTFASTYEAISEKPGYFRKKALVRAVQMRGAFYVRAIDEQSQPEIGGPGDYLVETVRSDGVVDRYLIREKAFESMYMLAVEG